MYRIYVDVIDTLRNTSINSEYLDMFSEYVHGLDMFEKAGAKKEDKQKSEQGKAEKKKSSDKKPGKMSPEEVEQILKALRQNEKKVQKEFRRGQMTEKKLEKDW